MTRKICEVCGYNPNKPLGTALNDAKKGENINIALNANGRLWIKHKANCLRELPIEVMGE